MTKPSVGHVTTEASHSVSVVGVTCSVVSGLVHGQIQDWIKGDSNIMNV